MVYTEPPVPTERNNRVFKKLIPTQNNFFGLFQEAAHQLVAAAEQFSCLTKDLPKASHYAKQIGQHEATADDSALATFDLLHKTFITPFDRYDIHQLTRGLDDVIDLINRSAQRIVLYQLEVLPEEISQIAELIVNAANAIRSAVHELEHLKHASAIIQKCHSISEFDRQAEQTMLRGLSKLFSQENDFKRLLKLKEIYEYCTYVLRECHNLADVIKGIVLEYS